MFRVGQKVVCVEGCDCVAGSVKRGNLYTIVLVGMFGTALHVDVAESLTHTRLAWRASRFRPIVENKTDIGFAHEILRKESHKERA